jgi:hypothetical protein
LGLGFERGRRSGGVTSNRQKCHFGLKLSSEFLAIFISIKRENIFLILKRAEKYNLFIKSKKKSINHVYEMACVDFSVRGG